MLNLYKVIFGATYLSLVSTTALAKDNCAFLESLSPYQTTVAYQAYRAGEAYDLGITAVAISWEESKLGKYKVRYGKGVDVSVGVMHTAVHWKTKKMSAFERGMWVESMITNDAKAIQTGVSDLLYWKDRAKGDYKKMVNGYNAGSGKNPSYVKRVISVIKELKTCNFD
jgi:hypothetical protein